jgi:hypothetical protein
MNDSFSSLNGFDQGLRPEQVAEDRSCALLGK